MNTSIFFNIDRQPIPHVTETQMREVDRVAVEEFNLGILQMMENAGRNLALQAMEILQEQPGKTITIAAGSGGNGGGGLCAARHLHNRGYNIDLLLTKPVDQILGAAKNQLDILTNAGLRPTAMENAEQAVSESDLVIDALIGYSLRGAPAGNTKKLIRLINQSAKGVLSLDLPSGIDATNGETPGEFIEAERTLTLALPKPGLQHPASGQLFLADIGIPPQVYQKIGIELEPVFGHQYTIELKT
ncbi:MAG: NAD(P)H-hydrate epimerase [Chloroflexota bacterium]